MNFPASSALRRVPFVSTKTKSLIQPTRVGQSRVYAARDRARLALILRGKRVGFSLDEIKEMLDLYDVRDGQATQLSYTIKKFSRAYFCA